MESAFFLMKKCSMKLLNYFAFNKINVFTGFERVALFFLNKVNKSGSFVFFVLFCINSIIVEAQVDPQFSQYMFNQLCVNPGYTGIEGRINFVAVNRQQWVGMEGAPKTTVLGADMSIKNLFGNPGGVGLVVMNDEIGLFRNTTIEGLISQKFDVGEGTLGAGLSVSVFNQVFDGTGVVLSPEGGEYHQSSDNYVPTTEVSGTTFDFGLGAYFKQDKFYGGISVLHLFEPEPNFKDELNVYIPRSVFITGGYNYGLWEAPVVLKPSFFLKESGGSWQLDLNIITLFRDKYWGGVSYRYQDAIVLIGGIELANGVKIGYSYDITTSILSKVSGGSHEVMLKYTFDLSLEKRVKRYKSVRFL